MIGEETINALERVVWDVLCGEKPMESPCHEAQQLYKVDCDNPYVLALFVKRSLERESYHGAMRYVEDLQRLYPEHEATLWASCYYDEHRRKIAIGVSHRTLSSLFHAQPMS